MGNTISSSTPIPLLTNTVATSYNRKGNYVVQSTLGTGNYGIVYKVNHTHSHKLFAMKVLQTSTSAQLRKFREEATILASLSHLHIVALEDIGGVPDPETKSWNACILTELADHNLLDFYTAYSALGISGLDEAIAQTLAWQMLSALTYLHDRKLAHGDIKPANILVFHDSEASRLTFKISDFGLAAHLSLVDQSMPTPVARYTAPELLLCDGGAEQVCKADVWAVGMVCRDLCTRALMPPHIETKGMGSWAKEAIDWMTRGSVWDRPTAKECRESVWVRQGERIPAGLLRVLRKELGLDDARASDEMEM
ncbi:kinase-like protein [Aureobasidium namibiae CBS 147.97]|uniref:Kinase-like protein n=1 Tax=Aureobasidium namibiae CBS 147.97 TaxID=1043004 RepID=A0A074WM05_9PEZI